MMTLGAHCNINILFIVNFTTEFSTFRELAGAGELEPGPRPDKKGAGKHGDDMITKLPPLRRH